MSKAQVAQRFGISQTSVCQVLKILDLDESTLDFLKAVDRDGGAHKYHVNSHEAFSE